MTDSYSYHASELELINDVTNPRRLVPSFACAGWKVLDIGCGIGQTLSAVEFHGCSEWHGIDVDADAIAHGQQRYPQFTLSTARAESIPYPDDSFDLAFSRVALPYTNIPLALREMHRVIKPGGKIWITLHDWRMEQRQIVNALRDRNLRRLLDRCYVLFNSAILQISGRCLPRPGVGTTESIQTEYAIRRLLRRTGFSNVEIRHDMHFLATATKPSRA
jgi:ubiquinone/menaquinone biosynthesis C-methylase UbiE